GYLTRYEYDNSNNRIREIIYLGKTVSGGKLDNIPCMITRYWYDDAGRKIAELDPDGCLKAFKYDNDGRIEKEVRYANCHLDISKDVKNISLPQEAAGDVVINHEYDVQGREFKTTNSESMLEVTRL